jgi:hypothetical protein
MVWLLRPVSLAYSIHIEETEAVLCALGILDNGDTKAGYIIDFQTTNPITTTASKPQTGTGSAIVLVGNDDRYLTEDLSKGNVKNQAEIEDSGHITPYYLNKRLKTERLLRL